MSIPNTPEPLKPAVFHILLALAQGDLHGYAVMQTVRQQSGGRVPMQTGSFYRHLARLIEDGLVSEVAARSSEDPRRGTHYRLTARGRQALEHERQYLSHVFTVIDRVNPRKGHA